jgi:hypothetical protein
LCKPILGQDSLWNDCKHLFILDIGAALVKAAFAVIGVFGE